MMRALVTGGGKRLGREMALYLARRGYDVAVHFASSRKEAEAVVAEIAAMGRRAVSLRADLLSESKVEKLVATAAQGLGGPLTVLVNNASIFEYDTIRTATRKSWDRHMESNLRAPFVLTQDFAAQVPAAGRDGAGEVIASGLVVNMIDQRVEKLTPEFMSYTLAKMGLWALTRTAAQALAPQIRVNAIGPGPTLQGARQSKDHFDRQRAATILERGANPADITAALGFFLDSPAVTGQMIAVDGGQHLGWQTPDVLGVE
jgi:NAD(P)-dependent dehydrogenase (short-subunit alcohol dehydrogenase family)